LIKKIINQTIKIRTTTHLAIAVLISLICFLSATLIEYQLKDKDRDNQICNECSTKPEEVNKYLAIIDSIDLEKRKDKTVKQEEINEYDALIEREAKNIDNAVNVSKKSVYSYLEYLADNIHEVSSSFLILALGVYILLTLLKVYSQERSKGWKRLAFTLSIMVSAIICFITYDDYQFTSLICFFPSLLAFLLIKNLYIWIKEGFDSDS
jgi:membrane-associated HD superfamily phosphohydrolase